jgi:hypothetical protein
MQPIWASTSPETIGPVVHFHSKGSSVIASRFSFLAATVLVSALALLAVGTPAALAVSDVYAEKTAEVTALARVAVSFHIDKTVSGVVVGGTPQIIDPMTDVVVYVTQCDGRGHNCVTIAANRSPYVDGRTSKGVATSKKPLAFGHVYKACATVHDLSGSGVNVCTAPMAYSS